MGKEGGAAHSMQHQVSVTQSQTLFTCQCMDCAIGRELDSHNQMSKIGGGRSWLALICDENAGSPISAGTAEKV